ncbi:MAG TPA: efflux RND transporter periplasmic adaptor subunit [Wenzhouxiangella sp.]|nr:efflux RND transporter periplasmic adaptor subunit [Wenzhouxiangella sp.]
MKKILCILLLFWLSASAFAAEPVTVRPFSDLAVFLDRQAAATAASLDEVVLAAEVSARVVALGALPGQNVSKGDLLVELDDLEYRIGLDSAEARLAMTQAGLDLARIRAERARRLAPDRFVSEDQLLETETNLRRAEADLAAAEADKSRAELLLQRTRIRAPFAGAVTERLVSPGTLAAPGTPLLKLVATTRLEVSAMIPPSQVEGLTGAEKIEFESEGRAWPLRLERVAAVIDPGTRGQEVRLEFINGSPPSGSEGRLRWTDPRPALPREFILQRDGQLGVMRLNDAGDAAAFQPMPGADAGRPHQPIDLAPDALLIDQGRRRVQPGERVDVADR